MFEPILKILFQSILIVPVLLGLESGRLRRGRGSVVLFVTLLILYGIGYMLLLHYLRGRWI